MYILIVDDDKVICQAFETAFKKKGFETEVAYNGEKALEILERRVADIVITDILMPNINGAQLIQQIKSHYPNTKVIAMSGGGELPLESNQFLKESSGADRAFVKPVKLSELMDAVRELTS